MSRPLSRSLAALLSPAGRRGRLAVFCYHQVLERKDPLRRTEPTSDQFQSDLETIGRFFNVLLLPEATERLSTGTLPARAACITFDDGYANNHELAAPLLERAGMPATFFIAGGAVDDGVMWNDLVINAAGSKGSNWIVEDLKELGEEVARQRSPGEFLGWTLPRLKYCPPQRRRELAEAFFRTNTGLEPPRLMMNRAAVADLARRGFDIGGHTLQHPILTEVTDDEAREEVGGCHRWIEEVTGRTPVTFAYPNGIPERDFRSEHIRMVQEAGFRSAVSTCWAVAGPGSDNWSIPRIGPWWRLGTSPAVGLLRAYTKSWLG
jgi:peptidoglycan/xylan/chitin deacetylase (PgdA/CDA1 family)